MMDQANNGINRFHYKRSKNSPPILVVAKPGTVILSSSSDVQRPSYHGLVPGTDYHRPQNAQIMIEYPLKRSPDGTVYLYRDIFKRVASSITNGQSFCNTLM
jgi:hypothetical protein